MPHLLVEFLAFSLSRVSIELSAFNRRRRPIAVASACSDSLTKSLRIRTFFLFRFAFVSLRFICMCISVVVNVHILLLVGTNHLLNFICRVFALPISRFSKLIALCSPTFVGFLLSPPFLSCHFFCFLLRVFLQISHCFSFFLNLLSFPLPLFFSEDAACLFPHPFIVSSVSIANN